MGSRDKINIGKDDNFFDRFDVSSTEFQEECDCLIKIKNINNLYFINTGENVIEYSFNGLRLHGDLIPGTSSAFLSFPNRKENKIWFRAPDGASTIDVIGYISYYIENEENSLPAFQSFGSSDISFRFATVSQDGYTLTLLYNTALDGASIPSPGDFALYGTSASPVSVDIPGALTVVITLDSQILYNETVTFDYTAGINPIQDADGNDAADLVGESTINNSEIGELPTIVSVTIPTNGLSLVLIYDESLNTGSVPDPSDYSLSGTSSVPDSIMVSGNTVTVTLDTAVLYNETVTLDYTASSDPVEDLFGNSAANLNNQAVDNNSEIGEFPTLVSAIIPSNGLSIILTYDESLNTSSVPLIGAFSLDGTSSTITDVDVVGSTVIITVNSAIDQIDVVTIDYTAGGTPIEDLFGNNAANLTNQAVTNNSTVDTVAPVLQTSVINTAGNTLTLTYSEALNTGSTPATGSFSLSGTSAAITVTNVTGSTVVLTLSPVAQVGETITVSYTAGASPIEDVAGNNAANLTNQATTNNSTQDTVVPVIQTKVINTAGNTLTLTYSEALNTGSTPATGAFSLTGTSATVTVVNVTGSTVVLTLSPVAQVGETITVSYTAGGAPIEDVAGNNAANLSNSSVTNNSTQDTVAPVIQTAVINVAGNTLTLTYSEALNTGSTPATGAFSLAGTSAAVTVVNVTGSTVVLTLSPVALIGETVTISYTAGGAPIEDVAGNNAANLVNQAVTNNSTATGGDVVSPVIVSIIIATNGLTAAFLYDEPLDTGSTPSAGAYTFSGTSSTASLVNISGSTVTVTFNTAVGTGQTVLASYTAGGTPVQDTSGNNAANLTNNATTNNSTVDITAPTLSGNPVVDSSGTFIDFTFSENMDQTSTPAAGDMDFDSTTQATIASFAWQSATVLRATLATHRAMGSSFETILIDYTVGSNPIRDLAGNNLASLSNQAVTNNSIHEPMVQSETIYASTTWTSPADLYGTSVFVELHAPGEGGITATKAGDAGYYCNKTDTIAANTGYAVVIGAAGSVGGGNGGDSTWRSTVCVAPGGGGATSPVGDVTRAGGVGQTAAGAALGGGSSGSTTAASGAVAGEINGAPGMNGNFSSRIPGAGGASAATIQRAGGAGLCRITCYRAPPFSGPYDVWIDEVRDAANTGTRDLTVGGNHQSGDVAIALVSITGASTPACSQATTTITTSLGTTLHGIVFAFDCDGTDVFTVTSSTSSGSFRVVRVRGAVAGAAGVEATGATGSGTAPNSGTHTPASGGSATRLVFAMACIEAVNINQNSITGFPADYIGNYTPQRNNLSSSAGLVVGWKTETASSYTPGAFVSNIDNWVAVTASCR